MLFLPAIQLFANADSTDVDKSKVLDNERVLKNAKFKIGIIFQDNDSIESNILIFKRRFKRYSHLYCVVKDSNDSIIVYSPDEIDGYSINNEKFIKHISEEKSFFIKHKVSGKVDLYYRDAMPYDIRLLYYLKFPNFKEFFVLSPSDIDVNISGVIDRESEPLMTFKSNQTEEKFKKFVEEYFKDCPDVINMVNAGYYTINDIPSVVKMYNSFFE